MRKIVVLFFQMTWKSNQDMTPIFPKKIFLKKPLGLKTSWKPVKKLSFQKSYLFIYFYFFRFWANTVKKFIIVDFLPMA